MAEEANLSEIGIDRKAEDALMDYHWPGNVRELSNILERALSSLEGNTIGLGDLPFHLFRNGNSAGKSRPARLKEALDNAEKEAITFALKQSNGNKARAARFLGIHRTLLYKKIKKHLFGLSSNSLYQIDYISPGRCKRSALGPPLQRFAESLGHLPVHTHTHTRTRNCTRIPTRTRTRARYLEATNSTATRQESNFRG